MASDMMKAHYDCLRSLVEFYREHWVWLYCLTWTRSKSPKLQPFWEGPQRAITQLINVVYRIHFHSGVKIKVVHLARLELCLGATSGEQPRGSSAKETECNEIVLSVWASHFIDYLRSPFLESMWNCLVCKTSRGSATESVRSSLSVLCSLVIQMSGTEISEFLSV
jgi:hypothetical protein